VHLDLLFDTDRFNLSEVQDHFINPGCFGEDLAAWLRSKLVEKSIPSIEPGQEDWGWYIEAKLGDASYFIGVGGAANESAANSNEGEWRIMVEKHRSIWEKLTGQNKTSRSEPIFTLIREILEHESDFKNVRDE
jgi:hypothetical protein